MNRRNLIDLVISFLLIAGFILLVPLVADLTSLLKGTIGWADTLLATPQPWAYAALAATIFAPFGALINHQERAEREHFEEAQQCRNRIDKPTPINL